MLKLDFGRPVKEILAHAVQREVNRCAEKMTTSVLQHTPIWTGVMINSWSWSHNVPVLKTPPVWEGTMRKASDGKEYPTNPLPRPDYEEVLPNFTYEKGEFPTIFLTCSVDYAFEVDQGVGRYFPRQKRDIVHHAMDSVT